MLGFLKPKLPITQEQQMWVDSSFVRLAGILGAQRLLESTVVVPTPEHFPDTYDGSEAALYRMFQRIAVAMQVKPGGVEITVYPSEGGLARNLLPFYSMNTTEAAGLYFYDPATVAHVSINESQLKEPMTAGGDSAAPNIGVCNERVDVHVRPTKVQVARAVDSA